MDKVKTKEYEVLFCVDPLDELCMVEMKNFEGKEIVDLAKTDAKGVDDDKVKRCK